MCPDPGAPTNGKRLNNDFQDGKLVAFGCNHNYDLFGSKTITCNGGVWSGHTPQCKGKSRIIITRTAKYTMLFSILHKYGYSRNYFAYGCSVVEWLP